MERRSRTRFDRMARCPSSSSPRAEERPSWCATTAAKWRSGHRAATRSCMSRRMIRPASASLKIGSSHNDAWLRHPGYGIYNPRVSSDGGWIAFNARTDRLAPRARLHRQGTGVAASPARKNGSRSARMAMRRAGRRSESPVLLVGSRWLSVPVGATARSGDEAADRRAAEHPTLPQPRAVVEEPVPRRAGYCRRARQDCLQPRRAHRQYLDDTSASRAGLSISMALGWPRCPPDDSRLKTPWSIGPHSRDCPRAAPQPIGGSAPSRPRRADRRVASKRLRSARSAHRVRLQPRIRLRRRILSPPQPGLLLPRSVPPAAPAPRPSSAPFHRRSPLRRTSRTSLSLNSRLPSPVRMK